MAAYSLTPPSDTHVVHGFWSPPVVPGRHQWVVSLGGLRLTVEANSHQRAKAAALAWWAAGCADPQSFMESLRQRVAERWRGGLRARLSMRAVSV